MLGAVLAGGQSSRMGEAKSSLVWDGRTFLDLAVETLSFVTDEVVVCGGNDSPSGVELVRDAVPGIGPLAGLASALHRAGGEPALVLAVDMPMASKGTLEQITLEPLFRNHARVARVGRRLQPMCGLYSPDLAAVVHESMRGEDHSMIRFLRSVPLLSMIDVDDGSLRNVNTPDEYQALIEEEA